MPEIGKPVVEQKAGDQQPGEITERSLHLRIRQQEILAELGVLALQGIKFLELLNHVVRLTAEGLEAEYCKVLEYLPAENRLLVRAGVGWGEGVVGSATVGADLASPAGFALHTGKPVISNHLENEQRFRTPELLVEHGIRRAMNVILQGDGFPFGVLEVDSESAGEFSKHDVAFLQGAANILGMAIEQQQSQRKLQAALDRHQLLLKEVNHRVKNSLQVVASMLRLQANAAGNSRGWIACRFRPGKEQTFREHDSSLRCQSSWAQNLQNLRVLRAVLLRCSCHWKPHSGAVSLPLDVRFGSKADVARCLIHVCFTPENGHQAGRLRCPLCATSCHMHRSKQCRYSITSSARASSVGGTVRPSALAVLRLIASSYLVGACTGKSAGFSPLRIRST